MYYAANRQIFICQPALTFMDNKFFYCVISEDLRCKEGRFAQSETIILSALVST